MGSRRVDRFGAGYSVPVGKNVPDSATRYQVLFADVIFYSKDHVISANDLNQPKHHTPWAHQWKMEFNPDPTKQAAEVLFSCKKSSPRHPDLIFNETVVTRNNEQNHLGFVLESKLAFEKHLNAKLAHKG